MLPIGPFPKYGAQNMCPSRSAKDSGSSATIEYKFSVCGFARFA